MLNNPYGCHTQALTPEAKKTLLAQRNGRIVKFVSPAALDRELLEQMTANNPGMLRVYRHYFGDNNLDAPEARAQAIVEAVLPVADLIDVCETGYNECNEGINDGIRQLAEAEIRVTNRIKAALHGMKVAGGCFSVGTPYNDVTRGEFQDFEAYASAFAALDYWAPHEYRNPTAGVRSIQVNGRFYGSEVLRYRYVIDWAKDAGVKLPPIYLGEFGYDGGGAGKGYKSYGISTKGYMIWARNLAPLFMRDIQDGFLVGAVFFCVGQEDEKSWGSFDLAGEDAFSQLLGEEFGPVSAQVGDSAKTPAEAQQGSPVPPSDEALKQAFESPGTEVYDDASGLSFTIMDAPPVTLWDEWYGTPGNEHVSKPDWQRVIAFELHALATGTDHVDADKLDELGAPPLDVQSWILEHDSVEGCLYRLSLQTEIPFALWQGVVDIETSGKALTEEGYPICRFEMHQWASRVGAEAWGQAHLEFRGADSWQGGDDQVKLGDHWASIHDHQALERAAIAKASTYGDRDIAYQCSSWGLFQLMGFHYRECGYGSGEEMAFAFKDVQAQVDAYWRWGDKAGTTAALRQGDLETFVKIHNGPGNVPAVTAELRAAAEKHGWKE